MPPDARENCGANRATDFYHTEVIFTTVRIFCYLFANGSTKKCREFSSVNYITDEISNEESQTDTLAIEQSINAYRFGSHTESAASDAENPGGHPTGINFLAR